MDKSLWIQLIAGILLIGLFLISWLVFKNIKTWDWFILILGIVDIIFFAVRLNKGK